MHLLYTQKDPTPIKARVSNAKVMTFNAILLPCTVPASFFPEQYNGGADML